jgi:hypothetical protein
MKTIKVTVYEAVIDCDWYGNATEVLLGVVPDTDDDWWEYADWLDSKVYYYLTEEEMAKLKAGDVLNDGEDFTIIEIDKDNPTTYEVNYEEEV